MEEALQMTVVFGSIAAVILAPIYWRTQIRQRVLETVKQMSDSGSPMSPELVVSLMSPAPPAQRLPTRQRDIRRGVLLLSLAIGFALVGVVAFIIARNTGGGADAIAIGAGVAGVGAIPAAIGVAFLCLGLTQKIEG